MPKVILNITFIPMSCTKLVIEEDTFLGKLTGTTKNCLPMLIGKFLSSPVWDGAPTWPVGPSSIQSIQD